MCEVGVGSQFIDPLGLCKPDIIYSHTQGSQGKASVCMPGTCVCTVKPMYYLSGCQLLYVRKEAAICVLEALGLQSQPGKQAHLHLQRRRRSQRCDFFHRLCLQCPFPPPFSAHLVGPHALHIGTSCRRVQYQRWVHRMGEPQEPGPCAHFVTPWTQTHDALGI